jgi:hypothetical protein
MTNSAPQAPMAPAYWWQAQPSSSGLQGTVPSASVAPVGNRMPPTLTPGMARLLNTGNLRNIIQALRTPQSANDHHHLIHLTRLGTAGMSQEKLNTLANALYREILRPVRSVANAGPVSA